MASGSPIGGNKDTDPALKLLQKMEEDKDKLIAESSTESAKASRPTRRQDEDGITWSEHESRIQELEEIYLDRIRGLEESLGDARRERDEARSLADKEANHNGVLLQMLSKTQENGRNDGPSTEDQLYVLDNQTLRDRTQKLEDIVHKLHEDDYGHGSSLDSERTQRTLIELNGVIDAVTNGDLSCKIMIQREEIGSQIGKLKHSVNIMMDELQLISYAFSLIARGMNGHEDVLIGQVQADKVKGVWRDILENVNRTTATGISQVRSFSHSIQAVVEGDFSKKVEVEAHGETLVLKELINYMIHKIREMVIDIIELGKHTTEGALGGRASSEELQGMWKALVENTNSMASVLTEQTRYASGIAHAVVRRDLPMALSIQPPLEPARGELFVMYSNYRGMLEELQNNWTCGLEVGKEDCGGKSQEEKLQKIRGILNSKI